jgi:2,5-dioxopentanoate dehydrogenase
MNMISGDILIGATRVTTAQRFSAIDPATGEQLAPPFSVAGPEHVAAACARAEQAFDVFRETTPEARATFLETIAANIGDLGDALIERAGAETGLPRARLEGERARTIGQLRLFADVVRRGDWIGVRIDPAQPERKPAPRADLRLRKIALGPVAVFGASNFPLAFSVAGGDTASAFAAGCPVVCKGHPAHPGTGELVGRATAQAVSQCALPEGVFSLLQGPSNELGAALVADPRIKAVGFTGSRAGGLALVKIAAARAEPIPVYAEMSAINPVALMPHALEARAEALGAAFVSSLTMGAGQFCTNPGLVIARAGPALDRFIAAATNALGQTAPAVMLTAQIQKNYLAGLAAFGAHARVETLARADTGAGVNCARGALFAVDARDFIAHRELAEEVFGAASLIVRCSDEDAMAAVFEALDGQLTATLHLDDGDHALAARLLPILERKAGRVIANGWPTGVEVCHAMVHGGPFPATSDARATSVGTLAIERFLRPVCYQDIPDALLPAALKQENPLNVARLIDGARSAG